MKNTEALLRRIIQEQINNQIPEKSLHISSRIPDLGSYRQQLKEESVYPEIGKDINKASHVYPALVSVGAIDEGDILILVDGSSQKLRVMNGSKKIVKEMSCSTASAGFGNTDTISEHGKTSTGLMSIYDIIGEGEPIGMGFERKEPTGKIHKPNESGNPAMTSRLLVLEGLQSENKSVYSRGIYIHGTNKESKLGRPASGGCIRVSNDNIVWLALNIPAGTRVYILGSPIDTNPPFPEPGYGFKFSEYLKDTWDDFFNQ